MDETLITIYVYLKNEGVDVWRPVEAKPVHDDVYRIVSINTNSEEEWEFGTGALVRCERRKFSGGETGLVVVEQLSPTIKTLDVQASSVRSQSDLESLHRFCTNNREALEKSGRAGCFYCGALFYPAEIRDWIDGRQLETGDTREGITALCPRCGIDAVLPENSVGSLTRELLDEMKAYWFH